MRSNKLGDSYFLVYTLGQEKLDSVGRQRDLDANIEKDALSLHAHGVRALLREAVSSMIQSVTGSRAVIAASA